MKVITFKDIKNLDIGYSTYLDWVDFPLRNRNAFIFPTKSRISMNGSDYCNFMPCALPSQNMLGIKIVNRNEKRREKGQLNLDSQIYLYSYDTCELLALMDGNYITTLRTAAVAVHSIIHMVGKYDVISLLGLGNISTAIGEMLFPIVKHPITVKLYRYKDQAERFIERFSNYPSIHFVICDTYDEVMRDGDVVLSCVSYIKEDFCSPSAYKPGCTVIPVHMRGFMECDKVFDNVIVSDLVRAKEFKYYSLFRNLSYTDDVLCGAEAVRQNETDRVLIYNLGLSTTDLYLASKIYQQIGKNCETGIEFGTNQKLYV